MVGEIRPRETRTALAGGEGRKENRLLLEEDKLIEKVADRNT